MSKRTNHKKQSNIYFNAISQSAAPLLSNSNGTNVLKVKKCLERARDIFKMVKE